MNNGLTFELMVGFYVSQVVKIIIELQGQDCQLIGRNYILISNFLFLLFCLSCSHFRLNDVLSVLFLLYLLRLVPNTFQVVIQILMVFWLYVSNLAFGRGMPLAWYIPVPAVQRLIGEFHGLGSHSRRLNSKKLKTMKLSFFYNNLLVPHRFLC